MKVLSKAGSRKRPAPSEADAPDSQSSTQEMYLIILSNQQEVQQALQTSNFEVGEEQLPSLEARRDEIITVLDEIGVGAKIKQAKHVDEKIETHRDFLLKEMAWLANDFQEERKRHATRGKKISKMVLQHHKQLGNKDKKEAKEQEVQLRRVAMKSAREIKKFWLRINQVVTFKQKIEADEARQKAMDKHLGYLVKQTERYTSLLAEHMRGGGVLDDSDNESQTNISDAPKQTSSTRPLSKRQRSEIDETETMSSHPSDVGLEAGSSDADQEDDDEFIGESEQDDETTLAQAEMELAEPYDEELAALEQEKEMSVEQLQQMYGGVFGQPLDDDDEEQPSVDGSVHNSNDEEVDGEPLSDGDYEGPSEEDDETTLIQAEKEEENESYKDELLGLDKDNEISVEELRAKYGGIFGQTQESDDDNGNQSTSDNNDDNDDNNPDERSSLVASSGTDDADFHATSEEDDETTLIEAENEHNESYRDEIEDLEKDQEIAVEILRAKYASLFGQPQESDDSDHDGNDQSAQNNLDDNDDNDDGNNNHAAADDRSSLVASSGSDDDDDFHVASEEDDETTLIEAEREVPEAYDEEIAALKQESEMSVSELRAKYAAVFGHASDTEDDNQASSSHDVVEAGEEPVETNNEEDEGDGEFLGESEEDDESTLIQAEQEDTGVDYSAEIQLLQDEKDVPIEELRRRYANLDAVDAEDSEDIEDDIQPSEANGEIPMETVTEPNETEKGGDDVGLALKRLQAADEAARAIQVERPYLLSPKLRLREYQQVGLNWLVSLHDRRLNGILADEMGLGKTIQTIALLAYLACYKGIWGPHLIVVPTSVLLNWESELKRWCPIFKVLTYYGSAKQRKVLRQGWSKLNTFHICITSYQLVVQDSMMFRRKRWYYMVLDEAHNIKNFKSQRWQTLLHFNTHRRLLLTGTPLQNNLMELWSLMHFLMPHLFRSRKEFSYWFSNPLTHMVEGNRGLNNDLIGRLHTIMRPFILRRLKKDVEKQLPGKYEHIVRCSLSKRQQFLYEEFMARTTTRSALAGANFMGMMNILMQLRKVCNHPDLFEPRPIVSPFQMVPSLSYNPSSIVVRATNKSPLDCVSSNLLQFWCVDMDGHVRDRIGQLQTPREWLVMMDDVSMPSPKSVVEPALRQELGAFYQKLYMRAQARKLFNAMLNAKRCNCIALPFSWRLMNAVTLPPTPLDLASSNTNQCVQPMECSSVLKSLILTADQRATQMEDIIEQYVFVIPKATSLGVQLTVPRPDPNTSVSYARFQDKFLPEFKKVLSPFYRSAIRQRMFFPDRKLVQFDSGKLQTLNVLLRRLKKEGHKCLIFTQMSRMLDILEAFLNLHGHTYVRLDGSTGVEKRQKLMDRFNADPKLFCFILSTRSGGLGINLTGADTVIFYDSDWNPAMDAQAQDRAHRIGQTRDVHIYRLVCGSTVEENILIKAKQKRHLDFLVMTEGNFTAESFYDQNSLKELLNTELTPVDLVEEAKSNQASQPQQQLPQDTEAVMLALEDEDDIVALKGAQKEVVDEMREFDENAPIPTDESSEQKPADAEIKAAAEEAINEQEVEAEFNAWQTSVGPDFKALEASLRPFEKYAVRFKTVQDPFYSLYYLTDQQKRAELEVAESTTEWDVEEIEREKENEEARAFAEGELLAAKVTKKNIERQKQLYHKQRSQAMAAKKRRKLTGEAWTLYNDGPTGIPFWYNEDTGEARYGKPPVIAEKERYQSALERGYTRIPVDLLQRVYEFLTPYPDRCACMVTCARWNEAGKDEDKFYKRVLPVESGAREKLGGVRLSPNDYVSIEAAIATALPGDTILLDPGHHWETTLRISKPLRFIGDVTEPSRVVIELRDGVHVEPEARLTLCGISIRRPAKMLDKGPAIECCNATVQLCSCIVNNDGGGGAGIRMVNSNLMLFDSTVQGALQSAISIIGGSLLASRCSIVDNAGNGVTCLDGTIGLEDTYVNNNGKYAVAAYGQSIVWFEHCEITNNQSKTVSFDLDEDVVAFQRKVIFDQRDRKAVEKFVALRETNGEGDDDDGAEVYSVPRVSKEKVELANNVVIPLPLPPSNPPPITKPVATPAPTSVAPIKHEISVSPQMLQSPQPKRQRLPSSEVIPTQGTPVVVESSIAPVASPVTTTFFPSQQLSPPQAAPQYHSAVHHHELNGSYGAYPMMPSAESMHPTPQMLQYSNPTMDYINSYQQRLQQLQLQTRELAIRQQQQQMAYSTMPQHYMMPTTAQYYASAYPQQQPQQHYAVDRNGHPIVYSYNGSSSQQQQQQQYYSHHQSSSSSSSSQNRYSGL